MKIIVRTWKMAFGDDPFLFGFGPNFRGDLLVSGRVTGAYNPLYQATRVLITQIEAGFHFLEFAVKMAAKK